ncbi:MAG: pyrroline-5-carboxylate reductase, partial [Maritimibacter sp.]|nr:pyrroline-5-carboxylate reductase [Maritimibacter sp.]
SAMLAGWLDGGLAPASVWVIDPNPTAWLQGTGVHLNADLPANPAVVLVAVKPQMMGDALPTLAALGDGETLFLSVAAGTPIAAYEAALGAKTPIVRAMPNTPAAIGRGITAIIGNAQAGAADLDLAESLLGAVGQVVRLEGEAQMDAVTAVSGSGPAYV